MFSLAFSEDVYIFIVFLSRLWAENVKSGKLFTLLIGGQLGLRGFIILFALQYNAE